MEKILMIPNKSETNYYLILLEKALIKEGIKINFPKRRYFWFPILKHVIESKCKLLHIHWLYNIAGFNLKNKIKSLTKLVIFLIDILLIKYIFKIKIVWTIHNLYSHESLSHRQEKITRIFFSQQVDALIAHCDVAKNKILKEYRANPEKIFVVPIGNYNNIYKSEISRNKAREILNLRKTDFVFLCFGPIRPYKGVIHLVKSFRSLNLDENVKLLIVGKPLNDKMKKDISIESREIDNIIFIPNFIPSDEIQYYMNAADAVVFPYQKILTSAGILLAMSFRKTIVAPKLGCLINMLDEKGSFIYDPKQEDGLVLSLQKALKNKDSLIKMGEYNYNLSGKFDWDKIGNKTKKIYMKFIH